VVTSQRKLVCRWWLKKLRLAPSCGFCDSGKFNVTLRNNDGDVSYSLWFCSAAARNADDCRIGGKSGLLLEDSCYLLVASSEVQRSQGNKVSWFKAVSHCTSLDSSLASIDMDSTDSSNQLANYLSDKGLDDNDHVWIGLNRRPWEWVQQFDPGKSSSSSVVSIINTITTFIIISISYYSFFCFIIITMQWPRGKDRGIVSVNFSMSLNFFLSDFLNTKLGAKNSHFKRGKIQE